MWKLNDPEVSFTLNLANACKRPGISTKNAIDNFYAIFDKVVTSAAKEPFNSDKQMQILLFIPLFGAAELYFRRVIAGIVSICPYAREKAGTQLVTMGALASFGVDGVTVAIGEHEGFTSKGQIANRTRSILGVDLNSSSTVVQAIKDFESVCHMRHAIVHLNGELLYLNRRELGMSVEGRLVLAPAQTTLQDVAAKVSNAVRAYNAHVWTEVAKRWLDEGFLKGRWKNDRVRFSRFIDLAFSKHDAQIKPTTKQGLYQDLLVLHPTAQRKSRFVA